MKSKAFAFALVLLPAMSFADDAASPAPAQTAAAVDTLAPPDCQKPSLDRIGQDMTPKDADTLNKQLAQYRDCMEAYKQNQLALAQKHNDAGRNATLEFNQMVKDVNAKMATIK